MPPDFIADSDDSDDAGYSSPPSPQQALPAACVGPEDRVCDSVIRAVATSSTDPVYFQSILDEQNEAAARESVRRGAARRGETTRDGRRGPSSGVKAGRATDLKDARSDDVNGSSLSSVTDPMVGRRSKGLSNGGSRVMDGLTQVTSSVRKGARGGRAEDPWEIPSSPDDMRPLQRPGQRAESRSEVHPTQISEDVGFQPRKRRRTDDSPSQSNRATTEDSMATIPFSNELPAGIGGATPDTSSVPPTLPIGDETSFVVAPRRLTDSQRVQYRSVGADGLHGNSSGSATNINTQRTQQAMTTSSLDPCFAAEPAVAEPRSPAVAQRSVRRLVRRRRSSSPDEIAILAHRHSSPESEAAKYAEEAGSADPAEMDAEQAWNPEEGADYAPELEEAGEDEDGDTPYSPAPTKAKARKPRGRPKKDAGHDDGGDAPSRPMPKRKRGRPKKADVTEASEVQRDQADELHDEDAQGEGKLAKSEVDDYVDNEEVEETPQKAVSGGTAKKTRVKRDQKTKKKSKKQLAKDDEYPDQDEPEPPRELEHTEHEQEPRPTKQEEEPQDTIAPIKAAPSTKQQLQQLQQRATSAAPGSASKPIYRVGLSKRSRIAPLLKSLRK